MKRATQSSKSVSLPQQHATACTKTKNVRIVQGWLQRLVGGNFICWTHNATPRPARSATPTSVHVTVITFLAIPGTPRAAPPPRIANA